MSHFSVLVIGENPEQQLAPYHEFECTGDDNEFVQNVDITAEIQELIDGGKTLDEALDWHGIEGDAIVTDVEDVGVKACKFNFAVVKDGVLVSATQRTNPNAKWDWYQLGGRWNGFFKAKAGSESGVKGSVGIMTELAPAAWVDQLKKGDIDLEGMMQTAIEEATKAFDKFETAAAGRVVPDFKEVLESVGGMENIDKARKQYNETPVIQDLRKEQIGVWDNPSEVYGCGREEFVRRRTNSLIVPFAFIYDGEWYQKGDMGWWGMSTDEMTQDEWNAKVLELFSSLPDDTLVSLFDCHI